jgi:hypothetical protein
MQNKLKTSISLFVLLISRESMAQTFSYDGNRWYEIEVSIFTNQNMSTADQELFLPEHVELFYPEPILQLTPYLQNYYLDSWQTDSNLSADNVPVEDLTDMQEAAVDLPTYEAELREVNTDFRLIDKARDPFISLGEEEHEFTRFNRNINQSPGHRILFHAVWRQPVLNKIQASAILVNGGDRYGQHSELEGSLIISYNVNRVDVDARLWRNSFNIISDQQWNVPLPPFAEFMSENNENAEGAFDLLIDQVYPMLETRQMISNQLHYLDHPALGMLIEVRPYELPPVFDFSLE